MLPLVPHPSTHLQRPITFFLMSFSNYNLLIKYYLFVVRVHVLIVQAMGLPPMDNGINSDPYCKVSFTAQGYLARKKFAK